MTEQERVQPAAEEGWHLDKKVPISIIAVLFLQFIGGVWYLGKIEARVAQLEHDQVVQHDRDERQDRLSGDSTAQVRDAIREMNAKLDRIIERGLKQ